MFVRQYVRPLVARWYGESFYPYEPMESSFFKPPKFCVELFKLADLMRFFEMTKYYTDIMPLRALGDLHEGVASFVWVARCGTYCLHFLLFWSLFTGIFPFDASRIVYKLLCPGFHVLVVGNFGVGSMGGDIVRVGPDMCDEWKAVATIWHICKEGRISQYMEAMIGHDEGLSNKFVTSWNDGRVTIRGISFEVSKEVIARVTGLPNSGRTWNKTMKVLDQISLN